jgi:hypothetical protein
MHHKRGMPIGIPHFKFQTHSPQHDSNSPSLYTERGRGVRFLLQQNVTSVTKSSVHRERDFAKGLLLFPFHF